MRYEVLLWDLDGTLTDPKEGITRSVQYSMKRLNYPIPKTDDLDWIIGPPLKDSFRILLETEDETLINDAVALYRERYREIGIFENVIYPGIPELLVRLNDNGCRNLLATSKPKVFAERILKHFSIDACFYEIMGSELDGKFVEKEALIAEVLKSVPVDLRSKTVMIGDRRFDVQGAKKNRIDVISVGYGYGTPEELRLAAPDYIIPTVKALEDMLFSELN